MFTHYKKEFWHQLQLWYQCVGFSIATSLDSPDRSPVAGEVVGGDHKADDVGPDDDADHQVEVEEHRGVAEGSVGVELRSHKAVVVSHVGQNSFTRAMFVHEDCNNCDDKGNSWNFNQRLD